MAPRPPHSWLKAHDIRAVTLQLACIALVLGLIAWLIDNTLTNLATRSIASGFDFLTRSARFPISESVLPYAPSDTFLWAFVAGLANTVVLAVVVAALSTGLGLVVALARRSTNPLALGLSTSFVELMRNTPVVVQLLFWYALVTLGLPNVHAALSPVAGVFLSDRGLYFPRVFLVGVTTPVLLAGLASATCVAAVVLFVQRRRSRGLHPRACGIVAAAGACAALVLAGILGGAHLAITVPELSRFNFVGGSTLTPELVALVLGLVLYSAAFVGEIIRGGIEAVGAGQWEAGRSLGLNDRHTLRFVIVPQALRIIIPPMTSQYVNILKNTTLALVVGYPDLASVTATTINQTGQAIEGIVILMSIFLILNLSASALMNWVNRRVALVQR